MDSDENVPLEEFSENIGEPSPEDADASPEEILGVDDGFYRVNMPQTSYEDALDYAIVHACESVKKSKKLTLDEKLKWLKQLNDPGSLNSAGRERLLNIIYDRMFPEMEVLNEDGTDTSQDIQDEQCIFEEKPYQRRDEILNLVYEFGCMNFPYVAPYRNVKSIQVPGQEIKPAQTPAPKIYIPDSLKDFDSPTLSPSLNQGEVNGDASDEEEEAKVAAYGQVISADEFAYYDEQTKWYWIKNNDGRWISIYQNNLVKYLLDRGFQSYRTQIGGSPCDKEIMRIQQECSIVFAGQVAGLKAGIHNDSNIGRFLVKENPKYISPIPGNFPTIEKLFDNLFNDPVADQRPYLYGWLNWTMEAYYSGVPRRGHALILVGPPNTGKSFFQDIFTAMVGGGVGRPYQYMTGQTTFNSDMFAYVHQRIEDESAPGIFRSKDLFTEKFKELVTHVEKRCHPKGREALTLIPLWRLTMSLNDEPDCLKLLPRLTNSIEDKVMIFRVGHKRCPMPTSQSGQEKLWNAIKEELPHFVDYVLKYKIPATMQGRYGIKHFSHPELVSNIVMASPEGKLLHFIDILFFRDYDASTKPIQLTAGDIQQKIKLPSSPTATEAREFFVHNSTCANYLGKLTETHPQRVRKISRGSKTPPLWEIHPPQE